MRELSDDEVLRQAETCREYVRRGGRGASFWLDSKGFAGDDRAAIVLAMGELDEQASTTVANEAAIRGRGRTA